MQNKITIGYLSPLPGRKSRINDDISIGKGVKPTLPYTAGEGGNWNNLWKEYSAVATKMLFVLIPDPIVLHLGIYSTKMGILIRKIHCGAVYSSKKEEIT